jgi:hypothetical protein
VLTTDSKSDTYSDKSKEEYKILQRQWLQMQKTKEHKEKEEEEKCKKIKYKNKRKEMNQKQKPVEEGY